MLNTPLALILAGAVFSYALLSRWTEEKAFTAPMLFTALGILVGPLGLNLADFNHEGHNLMLLAEVCLALILFTDASQIKLSHLVKFEILPVRLLAIGLPLTIVFGTLVSQAMFASGWLMAMLLAIILTPTDAALAQSIFGRKDIDESLRHSITVESGLNDGIALPILLFVLALFVGLNQQGGNDVDHWYWLLFISEQFLIGTLWGVISGRAGGWLVHFAYSHQLITPMYQRLAAIALALLAYSGAEALNGNGFIAAFVAGLLMQSGYKKVQSRLKEFNEAEGQLLSLLVFFFFGMIFVPGALADISLKSLIFALFALTLMRILPVFISLTGSGLPFQARLFLSWFGPRGIASIIYLLLVSEQIGLDADSHKELFATTVLTILLSIFMHGISARFFHNLKVPGIRQ
ncbi:MAG: hypothetical protein CMI02_17525 [Oceanospirillaceae bacterium]|nr:hypothetical protein [Oceanospirillaceae bacterium]MBT13824.1 hypothetical protein [Oceanospirillaceae bacterium]|tara:strand:- start:29065 stop:30282 length:1218 start_codon:yes stop_codon:yes gene_type:complete